MRTLSFSAIPAAMLGLAVFMPSGAGAQVLKCYDHDTGGYVVPGSIGGATNCEGSVNKFFENDISIVNLTDGQKIKRAVELCGLANGPYRRQPPVTDSSTVDTRLDYVTATINNPGGTALADSSTINAQIGINPGASLTLRAIASGSSSSNSAMFEVIDSSTNEDGAGNPPTATFTPEGELQLTGASQIADLPGFDFAYFDKSSGNAQATLICDQRMWFEDNDGISFGIANYAFNHNVNKITVGWAMGPSGFGSQGNADTVCAALNANEVTLLDQVGRDMDSREKYTGILGGFYKTLAEQPDPPQNLTSCAPTETSPRSGHAFYCDDTEPAGSVNSCNPNDGALNGGLTGVSIGAVGDGTNFYFGGTGPMGGTF